MANNIIAYLGIGSNIDDRMSFIVKARDLLNKNPHIEITKESKIYETEPWPRDVLLNEHPNEEKGQKWYLNQVVRIETSLQPQQLMETGWEVEKKIGRNKREHWGDREIDVDVLLYEGQIIDTPNLQLPHRHMMDRQFVLVPLVEIAHDLVDPITGHKFRNILEKVKEIDDHKVTPFL